MEPLRSCIIFFKNILVPPIGRQRLAEGAAVKLQLHTVCKIYAYIISCSFHQ